MSRGATEDSIWAIIQRSERRNMAITAYQDLRCGEKGLRRMMVREGLRQVMRRR
jgi:hypothetical protein